MPIDPRFLAADTRQVFTGNELLVKGCLEVEGGVNLLTGYPGSPIAGFFDAITDLRDVLKPAGVRAFQANNEALSVAAVNGSQMMPLRAVAAFKSVGMHVASDALALGNLAGAHPQGGAVIILGDDPWCESTQVAADSRYLCQHLRMPVIEPGSPQQLKDWINLSFKVSAATGLYIGYVVTVAQADGGGSVWCAPNQFPRISANNPVELPSAEIDLDKVLLPPRTWQHELKVPERFAKAIQVARELGLNRIDPAPGGDGKLAPLGFIVTGMAGPYVRNVLADMGLAGEFPVLQMGMSYPTDWGLVRELGSQCRTIVVVEERRGFLEQCIREALFHELPQAEAAELCSRLYGKAFPSRTGPTAPGFPASRGLNYSLVAQKVIELVTGNNDVPAHLRNERLNEELERLTAMGRVKLAQGGQQVVPRTPTFCPGCPHRDSAAVLLEMRQKLANTDYMKRTYGRGPVDLVAHGDTGCYTMLMFAPNEQLMHNYSGMGLGGGTGSGIAPFIRNKQIAFMGDSTFFHSGQVAISNSIKAGQDITYILLNNGTTAMTGHQGHAGSGEGLLGETEPAQDIETVVRGMAGSLGIEILRLSPANRGNYGKLLEQTILRDGVKIVIADKECGITHNREVLREEKRIIKKKGYLPRKQHMNVTPEVCENCLACTQQTACPGLTTTDTDYGKKIDTDLTWCVNDGACDRVRVPVEGGVSVKACPSFEEITVVRHRRRRYTLPNMSLDKLPDPERIVHDMSRPGSTWRAHMAGVGGMGIGVVGAILVRAGHEEGYRVVFADRKGLAIRNGGVYSQITFVNDRVEGPGTDCAVTASIPWGKADLLVGVDILEAARAIDPREQYRVASPDRTCAVLNMYKQPTVYSLLGRQEFDPEALRREILGHCLQEHSYANNLSEICERRLGSKQFVNIMMLGVAYQLGLIPVSAHSIAWAIKDSIPRDHRKNLKAFNIGRKLALEPRILPPKPEPVTWGQLLTNKARILRKTRFFGRLWSDRYEHLVNAAMKQMPQLSEESKYDLAVRIYDILQYDDHRLARRYVEMIREVYRRDSGERAYAATRAAIWNLAKVILIKDEPYVAYLLTRYEKHQRDIVKYNLDVANGDRILYRHHTYPEFTFFRWRIRFELTSRDWMLHVVRRCKWWRRIPGWHRREVEFRQWYMRLLERVDLSNPASYDQAIKALRCVEDVTGYREIRYPKMDRARREVEAMLAAGPPPAPKAQLFVHALGSKTTV